MTSRTVDIDGVDPPSSSVGTDQLKVWLTPRSEEPTHSQPLRDALFHALTSLETRSRQELATGAHLL